jgi:hypothetical protein
VIGVLEGKVTKIIPVAGDPYTILPSLDGRLLYAAQPGLGQVGIILAETGRPVCIARLTGKPAFLALDQYSSILYAAEDGAARVTALDSNTCAVRHIFKMESPVYGLAIDVVATGSSVTRQLWVAGKGALAIFDGLTEQQLGNIPIPNGPQYLSLPPGDTVYVTTQQGTVDAVDIRTRVVHQLLTGGPFGPMDYNALTYEVFVPDEKHNVLDVLSPVFAGTTLPKEPNRVIHTEPPPVSVAITNDGQLGFIALRGGKVVMLDLLRRQFAYTVDVGGTPHFIITGLYPPTTHIPLSKLSIKQAPTQEMIASHIAVIIACMLAIVFLVLVLVSMLQRRTTLKVGRQRRRSYRH